ncbi:MAG: hypothetical protein HY564_02525 [Candidatus Jacksonbacteria bacterium]|nr:hypothetical protein [Candidatus Jacksonbacteria bacterium]
MRYFFIFGNHPSLSSAETYAILGDARICFEQYGAIVESEQTIDLAELQGRLGGVVKCGVVLGQTSRETLGDDLYERVKNAASSGKKFSFGISAYGARVDTARLGLSLKKRLKSEGMASRFVTSKNSTLSSVVVKTNKLLTDRGVEFILLQAGGVILLGETSAVQTFAEFSALDYGRPARDAKSGMIPPKLARMMINLACLPADRHGLPTGMARVPNNGIILDPFCGSGTILQEVLLMGYRNIVGADVSEKAIDDTKINLAWLGQNAPDAKHSAVRLILSDVRSLSQTLHPQSVDAIITEPYLGPPLTGKESERDARMIIGELERLYESAFRSFHQIIKNRGVVVIIFPIIRGLRLTLPSRFSSLNFAPDHSFASFYDDKSRGSFVYERRGQKIRREIFILQKQ